MNNLREFRIGLGDAAFKQEFVHRDPALAAGPRSAEKRSKAPSAGGQSGHDSGNAQKDNPHAQ